MYKSTGIFNSAGQNVSARSLWTRDLKYPQELKTSWTINNFSFPTSTFGGKKIKDEDLFQLFTNPSKMHIAFRGQHKDESDCTYNQKVHGVIAREPSVFKLRGKELEIVMDKHQAGDVKGLPTSLSFNT